MGLRTLLALLVAALLTASLGGGVLTAQAVVRTFELTLTTGQTVTVEVDVPADEDPWEIDFPDVPETQVVGIAEIVGSEAETAPPPPSTISTEPLPTTVPQDGVEPEGWTPKPDFMPGEEPEMADPDEPTATGKPRRQRTTGERTRGRTKRRAAHRTATQRAASRRAAARRAGRRGESGLPAVHDPGTSLAIPGAAPIGVPNFFIDKFRIPPFLLSIYQAAGVEYGVRWEVLAAINEIETDYGRNLNVSSAGALGWMQFMPATWKAYGVDANGDGKKDPYNPVDAIFAAARYLKAAGADEDLARAIFAYNHADWYVDSVLMRARLIGGMPTDLVGSLTGLTQGRFPVAEKSRYADDLDARAAKRRVAKGTNAAIPVEPDAGRRSIAIYARPDSRAIAVQDGRIVDRGQTEELGHFVVLRDSFGNRYTYSHLGEVADRHPVLRDQPVRRSAGMYANPPEDPAPSRPASAGDQPAVDKERTHANPPRAPLVRRPAKERLFASPTRAGARLAGSETQFQSAPAAGSDLELLGLPANEVVMKPLRKGSRVIGGTVLGRIGRPVAGRASHFTFAIRPAGRGAPRIDPKPILDGWKLLESTAIYRARSRNPFFGRDARTPSIGQILLMGKNELEQRVLRNPRIEIYDCGRRDVQASRIDRRVLATLEFLAANGLRPAVTSLTCGHSYFTASGNVSHHTTGTAVDIAKINGIPILGHQGAGSVADMTIRRLLTLQGTMRPTQIISLMKYEGADNTLAMGDHADHIHVGFQPLDGTKVGRRIAAVLKPTQWIKLIDRLGEIDNPTVRSRPSADAITVVPPRQRASERHRGE